MAQQIKVVSIFVVDDNKNNIRLLTDILQDEGYAVYAFESGKEVCLEANRLKPDVILLDIMMPEMDGFEVCRQLKEDFEVQDIPVIMVTAKTEGQDVKNALELGAFDYIKKPIDETEVLARVQSALKFKRSQDRLRELAMKDGLTGLYNRAFMMESFRREFAKAQRSEMDLSFIMIDVDYFKKVNDTYGHEAGDNVLKKLAWVLRLTVRREDIICRYGGEEFGLILPGLSKERAWQVCQRILDRVHSENFYYQSQEFNITISLGLSWKSIEVQSYEDMFRLADEALYRAKANGRDRVEEMRIR